MLESLHALQSTTQNFAWTNFLSHKCEFSFSPSIEFFHFLFCRWECKYWDIFLWSEISKAPPDTKRELFLYIFNVIMLVNSQINFISNNTVNTKTGRGSPVWKDIPHINSTPKKTFSYQPFLTPTKNCKISWINNVISKLFFELFYVYYSNAEVNLFKF